VSRRGDAELLREVGRLVRDARTSANLTQEEAAHAAGLDWRRWQRLEAGTVNATVRTLGRVAEAVGVSFFELLGRATKR
jgi:transcriptional regulator with XRE-family HTH domain